MKTRLLLALLTLALIVAPATAKDSHAPAGAGDRWLPCENWAMFHWIPFNERSLYRLGGFTKAEFKRWIRDDDRHTLAQLVRRHRHDPEDLLPKLLKHWEGKVSDDQLFELYRRSRELMSQGHLAQHVFFHYFHNPAIALNSKYIFGVRGPDYMDARNSGFTPREIARHGGHSKRTVIRRAFKVLRRYANKGVRGHDMTRRQAGVFVRAQRGWLRRWWHQDIGKKTSSSFPRGNPAHRNNRARVTCGYFAGSGHVPGAHEDPAMHDDHHAKTGGEDRFAE